MKDFKSKAVVWFVGVILAVSIITLLFVLAFHAAVFQLFVATVCIVATFAVGLSRL